MGLWQTVSHSKTLVLFFFILPPEVTDRNIFVAGVRLSCSLISKMFVFAEPFFLWDLF